jgi:hypothetical protein
VPWEHLDCGAWTYVDSIRNGGIHEAVEGWLHVSVALNRFGGAEFRFEKAARASRRITSNQSSGA